MFMGGFYWLHLFSSHLQTFLLCLGKTPLEYKRLHKAAAFITFNLFIKLPSQPLLMPPDLSPQILSIAY